jgi:hypothetical protein
MEKDALWLAVRKDRVPSIVVGSTKTEEDFPYLISHFSSFIQSKPVSTESPLK